MAPFFSNWIVLLLTSLLLQNFSVHALPNPESSSSFGHSSSRAAAAVPRVLLFPRGRNAIEGLLTSTELVKRDSDDESPARKGDAGKHSTTHKTDKEHHVGGKVSASDKEHHVGEKVSASDKEHHVGGKAPAADQQKTDKEHHVGGKAPAADQQKTDKEHHVGEKVAASDQQKAVAGGRHPQTHLSAVEAARGGKVMKSGSERLGPAKPAGKGLGKGKGGQKSGAKGTGKSQAGLESADGKKPGVSLVGLGDPFYNAPEEDPCDKFVQQTDVDFVGDVQYSLIKGFIHQLSEPMCPPGSIGHAYSVSMSWSISGQIGPDMKNTLPGLTRFKQYLDKFGARAGVSYAWTNTQSTTYTGSETGGQGHPFVLTYQPMILTVTGAIQVTKYVTPFNERVVCAVDNPTSIDMHLPTHTGDDCAAEKTACGPGGVIWDHCFFLGAEARFLCSNRPLGPTPPPGRQCPSNWYLPQFIDGQGRIKSW